MYLTSYTHFYSIREEGGSGRPRPSPIVTFRPVKSRQNYSLYTILQKRRQRWSESPLLPPPPPPPTNNFDRVDEIQRFFMNPALCHAGSRFHKIPSTLSKVIGDRLGLIFFGNPFRSNWRVISRKCAHKVAKSKYCLKI